MKTILMIHGMTDKNPYPYDNWIDILKLPREQYNIVGWQWQTQEMQYEPKWWKKIPALLELGDIPVYVRDKKIFTQDLWTRCLKDDLVRAEEVIIFAHSLGCALVTDTLLESKWLNDCEDKMFAFGNPLHSWLERSYLKTAVPTKGLEITNFWSVFDPIGEGPWQSAKRNIEVFTSHNELEYLREMRPYIRSALGY